MYLPRTIMVECSTELIAQMSSDGWSQPVQVQAEQREDGAWTLVFRTLERAAQDDAQ